MAVPHQESQGIPSQDTSPPPTVVQQRLANEAKPRQHRHPEVIIYSHSSLFYWWPAWLVGFIMALVTYLSGERHQIGDKSVWFHPSSNLAVIFFVTLFLVILVTNIIVRGLASIIVILSGLLATVLLAYLGWWDSLLTWFGDLEVHLNLGGYVWFSTVMFLVWFFTVFVYDRLSYWRIKPGQVTQEYVLGASAKSYDTDNMVLEKYRDDFFRHWILGFGSGDIRIRPFGAVQEEILVPNVLFVGSKMQAIEHMLATDPANFAQNTNQ